MDPFMDVIDYAPWARGVKSAHYRVLSFSHVYLQYSSPCHYTLAQIICTPHSVVGCLSFSFRTVTHSAPQPSYSEALSRLESEAATFRLVAQCLNKLCHRVPRSSVWRPTYTPCHFRRAYCSRSKVRISTLRMEGAGFSETSVHIYQQHVIISNITFDSSTSFTLV